ncbi:hypothetical protein DYH09_03210 [bacterium CPR1]|nr:hypothetical protein [bacterium CPR1]
MSSPASMLQKIIQASSKTFRTFEPTCCVGLTPGGMLTQIGQLAGDCPPDAVVRPVRKMGSTRADSAASGSARVELPAQEQQ